MQTMKPTMRFTDTLAKMLSFSRTIRCAGTAAVLVAGAGCKDLTKDPGLPAGTPDPSTYNTPSGAVGLRNAAILNLQVVVPEFIQDAGLLSDELEDRYVGVSAGVLLQNGQTVGDPLDERLLPESGLGGSGDDGTDTYVYAQTARGSANLALAALAMYDTAASDRTTQRVMRGELFAIQGYTEILLAEMFCSGVPLSTIDFHGDYTYGQSLTQAQVYQDAVTKLDSALQLATGGDSVRYLAMVLQGRAHLGLGHYAAAADDVSSVPTNFQYRLPILVTKLTDFFLPYGGLNQRGTVSDSEGGNGLPYLSSGDPRVATTRMCTPPNTQCTAAPLRFPTKYVTGLNSAYYNGFVMANGIEARLIEAEAAFNAGNASWLTILNALRTDGTATTIPADTIFDTLGVTGCGPSPLVTCGGGPGGNTAAFGQPAYDFIPRGYTLAFADTSYPASSDIQSHCNSYSWYSPCYSGDSLIVNGYVNPAHLQYNAGTGGVNGLAPLTSASNAQDNLAQLFQERAYWLFVTGHRLGDMRRLLRQYGPQSPYARFRSQQTVFPTGPYLAPGTGRYGSDVNTAIPTAEYANPNYHGCIDRNA